MKVLIIVPAFNEEKMIGTVLSSLQTHGFRHIVVIDDGSSDQTSTVARKFHVPTFCHVVNRGLGAALATGFEYARTERIDAVVTFDSDGQHKVSDIERLLGPIEKGEADVVIGSRLINSRGMPPDRQIINFLSNVLTFLSYGVWTSDSQSGLRAFNKKALKTIIIKTDRMEVSSEFFREIKRNSLRFVEIPIEPIYTNYSRQSGQSNLNAFSVGFKIILRLFR